MHIKCYKEREKNPIGDKRKKKKKALRKFKIQVRKHMRYKMHPLVEKKFMRVHFLL